MQEVRARARSMRLRGYSYNEIQRKFGIPKSTLSNWFSQTSLSRSAQQRLAGRVRQGTLHGLVMRNKAQTFHAIERTILVRKQATQTIPTVTAKDLTLIGAVLYWAEGYKRPIIRDGKERTNHKISFVNADPVMIRVFLAFLEKTLKIPRKKICITMRLYPTIDEISAFRYWKQITNMPKSSFRKSTYLISIASKGKRPFNRLPYGTLQVGVYDTQQFHRLMGLIDGVKNQF